MCLARRCLQRVGTEDLAREPSRPQTGILESEPAEVTEEYKVVTSSAMHVDRAHISYFIYFVHYVNYELV